MSEILKWSFLGLGALFILIPVFYYWFLKTPSVNKKIADSAAATAKEINTILQKQIYSNSVPILVLFVLILYLLSWKFALIFLLGALFSVTARVFVTYFLERINPILLLETEKGEKGNTSNVLKVMTSIFVFGFAFLAILVLKLIFNDINILYALALGIGLETFLIQVQTEKSTDQNSTVANYFFIFSFALVILAAVAENFYPNFNNLAMLLWSIPIAGLKIFLLSLLINFLLKKIKKLRSSKIILPVSIVILSAVSFYLIPQYLFTNDQFSPLRIFLSLLLGLAVAIIYYIMPKRSKEEHSVLNLLPMLIFVFSMLIANYLAGYLGVALVVVAQVSLFWAMLSKDNNNETIHQNIITNAFGLSAILAVFLIKKAFQFSAFESASDINIIASLLLGGLIPYFVVHYSLLASKKPYINLFALISILAPIAIVLLFGSLYLTGLIIGILIVGIILSYIYQRSKPILYSAISTIFLLTILLNNFLRTDLDLTFKIIIAGVLLVSVSAFAIFKPETNE